MLDIKTVINIFVFMFILFLFLAIQSSVFSVFLPRYISPDLISCVLVYVGIKRELKEGVAFTIFCSYLVSLNSGMEFFPCLITYLICFNLARYIGFNIFTGTARSVFLGTVFCIGVPKLIFVLWLNWADSYVLLRAVPSTLSVVLSTSVFSLLLFRLFSFIDMRTERIEPVYIAERHRRF